MRVPLRIPAGWVICKNFFDDQPLAECSENELDFLYDDEILVIEQAAWGKRGRGEFWAAIPEGYILDMGWVPAGDPNGSFRLQFLKGNWDNVLYQFFSREHAVMARKIEQCLDYVDQGYEGEDLKCRLAEPPQ
jgi:hypothetical protein